MTPEHFYPALSRYLTAAALCLASSWASATVVTIDPALSSVTHDSGQVVFCGPNEGGSCGHPQPPMTYRLSGSLNVEIENWFVATSQAPLQGYDVPVMRLNSISIDSGGTAIAGFTFPRYLGILMDGVYSGSSDPCWGTRLFPNTFCTGFSTGFGRYSAAFDGTTLAMSGYEPGRPGWPVESFTYSLIARAGEPATISAPGTLACMLITMCWLVGRQRGARRFSLSSRNRMIRAPG